MDGGRGLGTGQESVLDIHGTHCILELYGCPADRLGDPVLVERAIQEAAREARSLLLKYAAETFDSKGVTAVGLLAESHISIHTWPEHGYAAADVFTCGARCEPERACEVLIRAFTPSYYHLRRLPRGPGHTAEEDEATDDGPRASLLEPPPRRGEPG